MTKEQLSTLIQTAAGELPADLVIKNCRIVNVFTHELQFGDIAVCGDTVAGIGSYRGRVEIDAEGAFALPGFIESHIHIESSMVTPEEFGRAVVPHGTTTVIADPHEIVNVCGMAALEYMQAAAEKTALRIQYMMPSCVPCTTLEHNGAVIDSTLLAAGLQKDGVSGVGEFMNAYGVLTRDEECLKKLLAAQALGKTVDGHAPGLSGKALAGYAVTGIRTDHECTTLEEMRERLQNGMYAELRYGSAAEDLPLLIRGVTEENARRCLFCSDDRHPETLLTHGDLDDSLRAAVRAGVDPITAVQMATLNAAECYGLSDRGAIAPGRKADIVLTEDLRDFRVKAVFLGGIKAAEDGKYLLPTEKQDISPVSDSIHVRDFSEEKLRLRLRSDRVHVIEVHPGSLLTDDRIMTLQRDAEGEPVLDPARGIARVAVVERHKQTGNVASGLLLGYGIQRGALAISIGHDSHNILTVGMNTADMALAVEEVIRLQGGIALAEGGQLLCRLALPVAGLMSPLRVEEVGEQLRRIHACAYGQLGISRDIEPILTLGFISLPVIPALKITDMGLFSTGQQAFISPEA